ncbi:MAG: CLC_0170 family protein [Caldicoprobacterales bacterium]|nr:hypothetical protein [Clostridiales bacterium]
MFGKIVNMLGNVFSSYFVGLTIFCSFFLSYVYPYILIDSESEFKKEYRIGKYVGYLYAGASLIGFITAKLFG